MEGNISQVAIGKTWLDSAESKTWGMGGNFKHAHVSRNGAGDPMSLSEEVTDSDPKTPREAMRI